mmetsp:Transcript_18635/g.41913  ORF Transcript_18635/g.41913 Transcript_18635/m.41913 type:complete len:291 (-) Transcript_18635:436-1308(-)
MARCSSAENSHLFFTGKRFTSNTRSPMAHPNCKALGSEMAATVTSWSWPSSSAIAMPNLSPSNGSGTTMLTWPSSRGAADAFGAPAVMSVSGSAGAPPPWAGLRKMSKMRGRFFSWCSAFAFASSTENSCLFETGKPFTCKTWSPASHPSCDALMSGMVATTTSCSGPSSAMLMPNLPPSNGCGTVILRWPLGWPAEADEGSGASAANAAGGCASGPGAAIGSGAIDGFIGPSIIGTGAIGTEVIGAGVIGVRASCACTASAMGTGGIASPALAATSSEGGRTSGARMEV